MKPIEFFGIDNDGAKMTHEKFLSNVHPLDQERVNKALGDSLADTTKNNHFIEHRITKTGIEKIVEERWEVDFNDQGIPLFAVGSCQDITERKAEEDTLRESELKFRAYLIPKW
jgi:PAS domain S-box-containing protein